jgi:hypothetical protein
MDVCKTILEEASNVTIYVYGKLIPYMQQFHAQLPSSQKERLVLHGFSDNSAIIERMQECEVAICPSASDAGPVPMAEALCQGCSVVGGGNVAEWAAETNFGTTVDSDTPESFARAVFTEIEKWNIGYYNRIENAFFWREYYSAIRLAEKMRDFVNGEEF